MLVMGVPSAFVAPAGYISNVQVHCTRVLPARFGSRVTDAVVSVVMLSNIALLPLGGISTQLYVGFGAPGTGTALNVICWVLVAGTTVGLAVSARST